MIKIVSSAFSQTDAVTEKEANAIVKKEESRRK